MIDCTATDTITVRQLTLAVILRNVNDQIKLMVSNHLHDVVLCTRFFIRPVNWSRFYTVSVQEGSSSGSCVNLIALSKQHTAGIQQIYFDFIAPEENITAFSGILNPVAIIEFSNASEKSSPIHPTSPVEDMSTPNTGSALCRREKEN